MYILVGDKLHIFEGNAIHPVYLDLNCHMSVVVERADPGFQSTACPRPPPTNCNWS